MRAPDGAGTIAGRIRLRSHQTACFALVAFAFLVAMVGTTLPTSLYALLAKRYAFGAFTVNVILRDLRLRGDRRAARLREPLG